jgi:hypothetical protein
VQYLFVLAQQMQERPFTPDGAYYQLWEERKSLIPAFLDGKGVICLRLDQPKVELGSCYSYSVIGL